MQDSECILILSTAGNVEEAAKIAERLVSERLVACVNILPAVQSVYRWNNAVQKEQETMMIIKTKKEKFSEVRDAIQSLHSYEVPEIISFTIDAGSKEYLQWLENSVQS